jgi:hypothetical protein
MPKKSRRKRGKQSFHGKKIKGTLTPVLKTAEQATATQTSAPAAPPPVAVPPVSRPVPAPTPTAAMYPYVTSELKRIGIIAAIIIAVLVILSRVLS